MRKVTDLIVRAYHHEIRLALTQDEKLSIMFMKDKVLDGELLDELKTHRNDLVEYFKKYPHKFDVSDVIRFSAKPIEHEGKTYYRVTPVQHYWLDDNVDKDFKETDEIHGSALNTWMVDGKFDPKNFERAVAYLIERHDSLRSTFHKINGEYLMRIESKDSPLYTLDIMDLRAQVNTDKEIEALSKFVNHRFDFEKGPLILIRLLRISELRSVVSIKIHHVITDSWSQEILFRDILVAYRDLMANNQPNLPSLKYQLKDYLGFVNDVARKNYDIHKRYWSSMYCALPDKLIVPDAKPSSNRMKDRLCKNCTFQVPADVVDLLRFLSEQIDASMFISIQATFKAYLRYRTGQNDVVIGTYVMGREYAGSEDQIGCYAKTVLIRTLFSPTDSFEEIMKKVLKSNLDMQTYNAYTLIDLIESKLPDKNDMWGSFWKFNLQYNDQRHTYTGQNNFVSEMTTENDIRFERQHQNPNSHIPIDMSLYFSRGETEVQLTIDYDSSQYDSESIRNFTEAYFSYIRMIEMK